jgi:glucose-6-phosphate 1-epimerase
VETDLCAPYTVTAPDGAELTACAHGGHVLGWTPAGGQPRLWLSPTTGCGPGVAIRGGIPVIFPQFASRGPLPKHGLARNRGWQVVEAGPAQWRAILTDDAATWEIWSHRFELSLTARAEGDRLDLTLTVRNTDDVEWAFTAALHTYLALGDPSAEIHGLGGRIAEDNAAAGAPTTLGPAGAALRAITRRDVAVLGVSEPLTLQDAGLGSLVLTTDGFPDRVLWNPGPDHGLADVPDGDERHFVCLEAAQLTPQMIQPASIWSGRQTLVAQKA